MKKTLPVNINGSVYYIDEDAYNLLNSYIEQLRAAFTGSEGREIVDDIESRISELFGELVSGGVRVIGIDQVNTIIEKMGRPADLADNNGDDDDHDGPNGPKGPKGPKGTAAGGNPSAGNGSAGTAAGGSGTATPPPFTAAASTTKKLYRDLSNRVFGGVFAGLGYYTGWNVNIMRLLYIILCLATYFWPLFLLYLVCWMIIPAAVTPKQYLEMTGTPVTAGTLGQTILGSPSFNPGPNAAAVSGSSVLSILGRIFMSVVGVIGACIGLAAIGLLVFAVMALVMYTSTGEILSVYDKFQVMSPVLFSIGLITLSLAVLLPCMGMVWGAGNALFNLRGPSWQGVVAVVIVEIVLIIATEVLLLQSGISTLGYAGSALGAGLSMQMC